VLRNFIFCVGNDGCTDPFSAFNKLNTLVIDTCTVRDKQNLCMSSVTLANLTILASYVWGGFKFELSTPSLCSFVYSGGYLQKLCASRCNLSSIKHVNISGLMLPNFTDTPLALFNWLTGLANIESLTVCSITLKVLYKKFQHFHSKF